MASETFTLKETSDNLLSLSSPVWSWFSAFKLKESTLRFLGFLYFVEGFSVISV